MKDHRQREITVMEREAHGEPGRPERLPMDPVRGMAVLALALLVASGIPLTGCEPDSGYLVVKEYDNVVTVRDHRADFTGLETFALPDSVVDLDDPAVDPTDIITYVYNSIIIGDVRESMLSAGFTEVDPAVEVPDLFVLVSVTNHMWREFPYRSQWWTNWGWYGEWPGWDEDSEVVYPDNYARDDFVFPAGTLLIDIVDSREPAVLKDQVGIMWTAVMNSVLLSTTEYTPGMLAESIDNAFEQSEYYLEAGTDWEEGRPR